MWVFEKAWGLVIAIGLWVIKAINFFNQLRNYDEYLKSLPSSN